ncbi:UDP-glycosyltransferase UGT4-like [Topomyia yanbarensis]|uniref:UDP-glycosyltransferase UGT4-like n=1 Tax=Topomyia yanbarensis TaxID=2498891 RepID=UPI00273C7436|nr:UDP-glycosyltransferase UGT4-like [Topomyia yanbarensis]
MFSIVYRVLLLSVFNWNALEAAKILGVFPTPSKSHWILGSSLLKELALEGHEVTDMSPFKLSEPPANYHHVEIKVQMEFFNDLLDNLFKNHDKNPVQKMIEMYRAINNVSNSTLRSPEVQALLRSNQQFDLVILEIFLDHALLGFAEHFKCPIIGTTTHGVLDWINLLVGTPQPLSYVPHVHLHFTDRMNYWQRLANVLFNLLDKTLLSILVDPVQDQLYQEAFPNAKRSLDELRKHAVSLVLVNSHFSLSFPRPYVPNMIEIGGFHVNRKANPLPSNIRNFIDNSTHGVVYFSLGTNLKPSKIEQEKRDAILKALSKLKQTVIWKWDDESLVLDKNKFLLAKWLPQDDILAHPNVKLFITHGGLLSCTESIHHGKPVVGIPIFADQLLNMARAELAGWGVGVSFGNLTEESLSLALNEVLNNEKYANNVQTISKRLRDQPLLPMDLAKYWVNYVLRHDGAEHIKSSAQYLNFIEYNNLDVYFSIAALCGLVLTLTLKLICVVFMCLKRNPSQLRKKKMD